MSNETDGSANDTPWSGFYAITEALNRINILLSLYLGPVVVACSVAGFALVFVVLCRIWRRVKGKDFVLFAITACDTLVVLVRVIWNEFLSEGLSSLLPDFIGPHKKYKLLCKVYGLAWTFSTLSSTNLICLLAVDRVLALTTPFYHRVRMTRRVYLTVLLTTLGGMLAGSVHSAFLFDTFEYGGQPACYYSAQASPLLRGALQAYTNFVVNGVLAGLMMLLCNCLLAVKIFRIRQGRGLAPSSQEARSAVTLVAAGCYYLACALPRALCFFSITVVQLSWPRDAYTGAVTGWLFSLANSFDWLFYWQCGTNWLLYFIRIPEFKAVFAGCACAGCSGGSGVSDGSTREGGQAA